MQLRDLAAFVNQVADAAGYKTTAQWARESGYPAPDLSNLRNGKKGIDGVNLLKLLRAASRRLAASGGPDAVLFSAEGEPILAIEAKARGAAPAESAADSTLHSRLEALQAQVEQAASDVTAALDGVTGRLVRLEEALARPEPQRAPGAARATKGRAKR